MMWGLIASFFTPTYLFLFLNLVIGIILLTSRKKPLPHHHHPQVARAPSLLERVKSINFSVYKFESDQTAAGYEETQYPDNPPPLARTPSLLERLKSMNFSSLYGSEEHPTSSGTEINLEHPKTPERETVAEPESDQSPDPEHLVRRVKSDSKEKSGSGSGSGSGRERFKEDETSVEKWSAEKNRVRQTRSFGDEEEEVDKKADDFINRFKNQLRLQRLDSLKRFGEMLKGR